MKTLLHVSAEEIIQDLGLALRVTKAQKRALTNMCTPKLSRHNVNRLTIIKERHLSYILEHHPSLNNRGYKTYKLKYKLSKHLQKQIRFWQPESSNTTSKLGMVVEKAFELAASDERRLYEINDEPSQNSHTKTKVEPNLLILKKRSEYDFRRWI
ncbi:hypothetical protein DPMN_000651 [Dreissena polymorpha]|uniref:Uncharacterized protein n=1 Tax=Dreissena polymorpha TaxID=45954 RepID=A0A9D4MIE9_DREPO|nr:hypothetical protein DPMN_000651 [Dreissena polymorpha]